jgi:RimJ/RimL family protein N-acetyltransferase
VSASGRSGCLTIPRTSLAASGPFTRRSTTDSRDGVSRPATDYKFAAEAGWTRPTDLELGYRLRRAAWGRGFATEASAALVRLALADPSVTSIVAAALVPNRASTRVMEKIGMVRVREFAIAGYDDPSVMYALCREGCSPP